MPSDTWVKVYRKLKHHPIMQDPTALQIFIWILISVDYETGKMVSGRFWGARELGMNPNTFYKALTDRLGNRGRYNLVTLSSNNKYTTILVNKWHKYQANGNSTGNKPVTTGQQPSNTNQEYKNKRNNNIRTKKVLNGKTKTDYATELQSWLNYYNDRTGKKFSTSKLMPNFKYWREFYTLPQMVQAIDRLEFHRWLHDKHTPALILRQKDQKQNPVDRIGELLSLKDPNVLT